MALDPQNRMRSRDLRKDSTDAERLLWTHLRRKQMDGLHFRRQTPIGPYFADFLCHEVKLIVELDGGHHGDAAQRDHDETRAFVLKEDGFEVLRFWNSEVFENMEGVLTSIRGAALKRKPVPPPEKPD